MVRLVLRLITASVLLGSLTLMPAHGAWAKLTETEISQYVNELSTGDSNSRYEAISRLSQEPESAKSAIPALTRLLSDPDVLIREASSEALGKICASTKFVTPEVIIGLKKVSLKAEGMNDFFRAAEALSIIESSMPGIILKLHPELVSESVQALGNSDFNSNVGDGASYLLGRLQGKVSSIVPALLIALESRNSIVRANAARAFQYADLEAQTISGELVLPQLLRRLKDDIPEVRKQSANSLGQFVLESRTIIPSLIATIQQDNDSEVRQTGISSLSNINEYLQNISPEAIDKAKLQINQEKDPSKVILYKKALEKLQSVYSYKSEALSVTIGVLKNSLKDRDNRVSSASIYSLCSFSKDGSDIIPILINIIKDQSSVSGSRSEAASALEECAKSSHVLISIMPELVNYLGDTTIHFAISDSIAGSAENLQDNVKKLSDQDLEKLILSLERALAVYKDKKDEFEKKHVALSGKNELRIKRSLLALQRERDLRFSKKITDLLQKSPWSSAILSLIAIALAYGIVLWLRPRWLLFLPATFSIPKIGSISPKIILWLKYQSRVMDAWITYNIGTETPKSTEQPRAKVRFWEIESVSRHQTYISLPLRIQANNKTNRHEALPLTIFQEIFHENIVQILIYGEGGIGKTSLACYLAKLAMEDKSSQRLCKQHSMLPILIEPELIEQELKIQSPLPTEITRKDDDAITRTWDSIPSQPLIEAIRKQVQFLINEQEPINDELLKQLLKTGRILVLIDRLSEMSDNVRQTIDPSSKVYPINALIITSRQSSRINNILPDRIEPLQLTGSELMRFIEEYLKTTRNIQLSQQPQLYRACENLQRIVEERGDRPVVTVLLAKLAADQLIAGKSLPKSIPDLMIKSLDLINEQVKDRFDNRIVRRDTQAIAWACLQSPTALYRPSTATLNVVQQTLETLDIRSSVDQRLKYLIEELRIVESVGEAKDQIRIVLDPMTEYLAGLHLVEKYNTNEAVWRDFLHQVAEFDKEDIQGFMLAVQDCCRVANIEGKVSIKTVDEIRSFLT
jgi:HEAT repeat protein